MNNNYENKCSLCGFGFDEGSETTVCTKCPLNRGCKVTSCPNCGFGAPTIPAWMTKVVHLFKRGERYEQK
jgi:hypothetical protein